MWFYILKTDSIIVTLAPLYNWCDWVAYLKCCASVACVSAVMVIVLRVQSSVEKCSDVINTSVPAFVIEVCVLQLFLVCSHWAWSKSVGDMFSTVTIIITNGQRILTKGCIAILSPLTAMSGFIRRWPSNMCLLGPTWVSLLNGISIGSAVFAYTAAKSPNAF